MFGEGGGFMGFGGGFMLIFWILFIVLVVWLIKTSMSGSGETKKRNKSALEILEERFAKGEIGQEEFEQKKQALKK